MPTNKNEPSISSTSRTASTEESQSIQRGIGTTNGNHIPSPVIAQPVTASPVTQALPTSERDSKEWALSELRRFHTEIGDLERSIGPDEAAVNQIEREINEAKIADDGLYHKKEEDIARVLQIIEQIKDRYKQEHESLLEKQESLKGEKESKLKKLKKSKLEVARKKAGVSAYQALVDYYNSLGDGS